ncbi:glycosyltransferase family 2 protein [Pseudomonadales bacterium]|nr:glycosyltransferase family 2 protein [Pseudomonadales bacterium]
MNQANIMNHTDIVLLNWNSKEDTIECLESLYKMKGVSFRVFVCDNGSTDDSLPCLSRWATEQGVSHIEVRPGPQQIPEQTKLVLIDNGANLGFAAGNNTGIALALGQPETSHVWLLNNDTTVEQDSLETLHRRMAQDQAIGACGSLIKFYDDQSVIQAVGGCEFNYTTGVASESLGRYLPDSTVLDVADYEARMDYISGAAMLLSREYLETVGLMEESYFLYYEEIDWAIRAKGLFKLAIAVDSIVYHKEGSAIGSASFQRAASPTSEFYLMRSKLRFMARHLPKNLPIAYAATFAQALNRFRRGQLETGVAVLKAMVQRSTGMAA